ncbi:MAG: hypothetical protein HWQ35_11300, partial [Nostoc sp. NMS1]|uniref:hypothetical protein n=1 Tax=unclassified Nostoc TaxID=2593658 RepID=UPI0025DCB701
ADLLGHQQLLETEKVKQELSRFLQSEWRDIAVGKTLTPGFLTTPLKACACAGVQRSRFARGRVQIPSSFPSAPLLHQTPEAVRNTGYF